MGLNESSRFLSDTPRKIVKRESVKQTDGTWKTCEQWGGCGKDNKVDRASALPAWTQCHGIDHYFRARPCNLIHLIVHWRGWWPVDDDGIIISSGCRYYVNTDSHRPRQTQTHARAHACIRARTDTKHPRTTPNTRLHEHTHYLKVKWMAPFRPRAHAHIHTHRLTESELNGCCHLCWSQTSPERRRTRLVLSRQKSLIPSHTAQKKAGPRQWPKEGTLS